MLYLDWKFKLGHIIIIILLINNIKKAIKFDIMFTLNKPLYIPMPDPIDWMYSVLKANTPAYIKAIALILLTITDVKRFFREGKEKYKIKNKAVNITTNKLK